MNLRTKFHLASASLILIVVAGVVTSLYFSEKNRLVEEVGREQAEDLDKLARVYDEFRYTNNETILINYVKTLAMSDKVAYAGYAEDNGDGWTYPVAQGITVFNDPNDRSIRQIIAYKRLMSRDVDFQGQAAIELSKPARSGGYVRLGYSKDVVARLFKENMNRTLDRLRLVGLIALLCGLILAHFFSQALSRPISLLMKAAEAIGKGQKGVKIPISGKDELGRLTRTFNHMSVELAKLDELKDEFMSHVTHELRSPLTSIIATVELMADMPAANENPKLRRSIDRLIYGSERLNRLVDNILDITRMEAGKMSFDIKPVRITTILSEMADFFEPRALEKGLTLRAAVPSEFPIVMADPERIRQVISNLIHNAVKFTNQGGIVLWARQKDGVAQIGVQDTGVGIPADKIATVFQKFETLKYTRDTVQKPVPGSGLGLNIVQNSIKAQGGKIWVESQVGKGSVFIFTLPIASAQALAAAKIEAPKVSARAPFLMPKQEHAA